MKLALFDLDNTLLGGDSDYLWGVFLCEHGYINAAAYADRHQQFYSDYKAGQLDIDAFLSFQLQVLGEHDAATLHAWRAQYIEEKIMPLLLDKGYTLLAKHRAQNHQLMIITATNRFVSEPIASLFAVEQLIACEVEIVNGQYTGRTLGVPSFHAGKLTRLQDWLDRQPNKLQESWFYSDSHNDLPLLNWVDHPVAVDPDMILRAEAERSGWPIISLR